MALLVSRIASMEICCKAWLLLASLTAVASCHTPNTSEAVVGTSKQDAILTPPPLLLRSMSVSQAVALNAKIPFASGPNYPAPPFRVSGDAVARQQALDCLATAVYYEASGEPTEGQLAVAQVVLNRVRNPAFPSTICGVVYQGSMLATGCQFSFTCDGSLERVPDKRGWRKAGAVAGAALSGLVAPQVGLSTHYHSVQVVPYWATSLLKDAKIGKHIFYRWPGALGSPSGFSQRYSSREGNSVRLRAAALIAHAQWPGPATEPTSEQLHLLESADPAVVALLDSLSPNPTATTMSFRAALRGYFPALQRARGDAGARQEGPSGSEVAAIGTGSTPQSAVSGSEPAPATSATNASLPLGDFMRDHRNAYRKSADRAGGVAAHEAADWQSYTGMPADLDEVVADLSDRLKPCPSAGSPGGSQQFAVGEDRNAAWRLLKLSFGSQVPSERKAAEGESSFATRWRDEIALAVFARVTALSLGKSAEEAAVRADVAEGYNLVPMFDRRLREFERRRDVFLTLTEFLPTLLRGVPVLRPVAGAHPREICAPALLTEAA
jgi:hypothetical protein